MNITHHDRKREFEILVVSILIRKKTTVLMKHHDSVKRIRESIAPWAEILELLLRVAVPHLHGEHTSSITHG